MEQKSGRRRHIMRQMCAQGDTVTIWETGTDLENDLEAQAAIREAERIFRDALVRGDMPFRIDEQKTPERLERWDTRAQEADEIVIVPRLMGG